MTDSPTVDFVGDFAFSSLPDGATPAVRARPMNCLLNRFSKRNAQPATHLFLSGGSLVVPAADDGSVAVAVAQCELQGEYGYVVELRTQYFRLFFDLDYSSYRILSEEDAVALLRDAVLPLVADCYPHATPHERRVILLSAPPLPVDKSTCVCIQDKTPVRARLFKSGFHLVFPDLIVDDEHALMVRRALVERLQLLLPKDFDHDGVRCTTWGDVLDECVFTKCGFRAVYQRKADKCAHCMPCTRTPRCLLATAACMPSSPSRARSATKPASDRPCFR